MVFEADFVPGTVESSLKPETGFNVFPFPSIDDSPAMVVGGGDTLVLFNDTPATEALAKYLTTVEAAEIWAKIGGFASLNKDLDPSVFPDAIQQTTAGAIAEAETFRFDLSDLQPRPSSAAPSVRGVQALPGLPEEPRRRRRHRAAGFEAAAKKAYG